MPGVFSVLWICEKFQYFATGLYVLFVGFEHGSFFIEQHFIQLRIHRGGLNASQLLSYLFGDFLYHRRPIRIAQLKLIGIQLPRLPYRFVDNGSIT